MKEIKLVSDINSKFRFNKEYGIRQVLIYINNVSIDKSSFFLARNYQIKGTNENTRRKIYTLMCEAGLMTRKLQKHYTYAKNTKGQGYKKRYYVYESTSRLRACLASIIKSLIHNNWIKAHAMNGIMEVRAIIKKFFNRTKFELDKFRNHTFNIKGKHYSLNTNKRDGKVYVYTDQVAQEWIYFYNLLLKPKKI